MLAHIRLQKDAGLAMLPQLQFIARLSAFVSRACLRNELVFKLPQLPAGNDKGRALRVFNIFLAFLSVSI